MTGIGAVPLSVVVAAWSGTDALARCLAALVPQLGAGDEVIVARNFWDSSADSTSGQLTADPRVRVVQCASGTNVPRLRAAGLAASRGALVAFLEDHAEPLAGWRDAIVTAFEAGAHGSAARAVHAVGGPVAPSLRGRAIDDAVWCYDYARFGPPLASGPVRSLSGANIAYERAVLLVALADSMASTLDGLHEASVERALLARGRTLWLAGDAVVRVRRHTSARRAIVMAYALARGFAARRVAGARPVVRATRALASLLVPPLLFLRATRAVLRVPSMRWRFVRASGWLLLLQSAWGVGECTGSLRGVGDADAQWR